RMARARRTYRMGRKAFWSRRSTPRKPPVCWPRVTRPNAIAELGIASLSAVVYAPLSLNSSCHVAPCSPDTVTGKSEMNETFSYAVPRTIDNAGDCYFYHKINIPGVGEVGDSWDLRSTIDDYLGRFNFRGKRVLDVGTASGFLTFEMERRGAEVVSFEMADGAMWDIV